jgi:iron complex outermembrane receptor protein
MNTTMRDSALPRPAGRAARLTFVLALALSFVTPFPLPAQDQPAGVVTGRVLNASTGSYLNNARVAIAGTDLATRTDENGEYRLRRVPAGTVRVEASFVGLESQTLAVTVAAGAEARGDFTIGVARAARTAGDVVQLEAFTVEEREMSGVAVALHEQRHAPNLKNVVSLDEFGDMGEGNVGEFLKYVPGLDIVYSPTNPQYATIRGMPASGTLVMFDGLEAASAAAGDTRQFDLATAASGNVDRLEVTKTPTPDLPANAVGGSINVISKSGFSRQRPLLRYEAFATLTALGGFEDFGRRLRDGAGSRGFGQGSALRPGTNLSYLLPLNKTLALNFAATYSDRNDDREFHTPTWDKVALRQTQNQMNNLVGGGGMQMLSGGVDWKVRPTDLVRLTLSRSYRPGYTRQYVFRTTAGAGATGDANFFQGAATGVGTAVQAPAFYNYSRDLNRLAASYRHDGARWKIDASASFSTGAYVRNDINEGFFGGLSATLANLVVRNEGLGGVSSRQVPRVTATDRAGAPVDVFNGGLLSVASASSTQQYIESEAFNAGLNVARDVRWGVPVTLKAGVLLNRQERDRTGNSSSWTFNPPGGTAGRLAANFDLLDRDNSERWYFTDVTGARVRPQWLSPARLFALYQSNPSWFTLNEAAEHTNRVNNTTRLTETITAGYLRVDGRFLANRLWIATGVRYERTDDEGAGPLNDIWGVYVRRPDGSLARDSAGRLIPVTTNAAERARLQYRLLGSSRKTDYDGYYPSFNSSFDVTPNLVARAAYARTIGRPNLNLIIPNTTIADPDAAETSRTITVSNGNLAPWSADNYDLTLEAYYVKGAVASVSLFRKDIRNFHASTRADATPQLLEEFGLPDEFLDYDIVTQRNAGSASLSGFELGYRQSLTFLPAWGRGIQIFGNLTCLDLSGADADDFTEFSPRNLNWGVSYARPRFLAKFNVAQTKWVRRSSVNPGATVLPDSYQYRAPQTRLGVSAEYRFSKRVTVYASVKNLLGTPVRNQIYSPGLPGFARPSNYQYVPAEYTFGVKGEF